MDILNEIASPPLIHQKIIAGVKIAISGQSIPIKQGYIGDVYVIRHEENNRDISVHIITIPTRPEDYGTYKVYRKTSGDAHYQQQSRMVRTLGISPQEPDAILDKLIIAGQPLPTMTHYRLGIKAL